MKEMSHTMKEMKKLCILASLCIAVACTSGNPSSTPADTAPSTPESAISLAPGKAMEQPPQAAIGFNTADPGSSTLQPRSNDVFPPVIPHSIADFEPIMWEENACLECHDRTSAAEMEAPAVPESHYRDLRNTPESAGEELARARHNCTACHVARTDREPLVEMTN